MKRWFAIVIGILFCVINSGCIPQVDVPNKKYERVFIDDRGDRVLLPEKPKRIVTLSSAYDTVLLGVVDVSRFAAVSSLTKYKGYSLEWEKARKVKTVLRSYPLERIIQLKPDLVIATDYSGREVVDGIRGMGIPIVVIRGEQTVEGTMVLVQKLAEVAGEPKKGEELVQNIRNSIKLMDEKKAQIKREEEKSVLFLSSMTGYAGTNSLFDDMCRYMGVKNAPSASGLPQRTAFTDERIVFMNPDYIYVPVYEGIDKGFLKEYAENPALQSTKAAKENHILPMNAAYLYTSNHHIGEVMLHLMKEIYPELFKEEKQEVSFSLIK